VAEDRVFLCPVSDLPEEGASRGFSIDTSFGMLEIFVVSKDNGIVAYLNSCPHTGGPLDWLPDQFLSLDGKLIQCATHDARFRIEDGVCVAGPCVGQRLQQLRTLIAKGDLYVDFSAEGTAALR
jgi:nitrite reductase/ring-hydroxylating ferredoxin subunit